MDMDTCTNIWALAWTNKYSIDIDMPHGNEHAAWTWIGSMDMGHAAWI
jgi:hypothetical protein